MQLLSSEAIVLRHVNYGEADRIVTFLVPEYGRLKGFARGARKSKKRFAASLEPFAEVILHWSPSGRGGLVTLNEAELIDLRLGLRGDLSAIALAGYGSELVEVLFAEEESQVETYRLLQAFLQHLDRCGGSLDARLLFEWRILALAGYTPHLLHCSACGGGLPDSGTVFDAARGGSLCPACTGRGQGIAAELPVLGSLSRIVHGPVDRFDGVRLSPATLSLGHAMVSDALHQHLQRPLKSLSFLEQILSLGSTHKPG